MLVLLALSCGGAMLTTSRPRAKLSLLLSLLLSLHIHIHIPLVWGDCRREVSVIYD